MRGQSNKRIRSNRLQQALRKEMTDAELAMWHILRGLQISGLKFRRQHPFCNYILDFVCLEIKLVIEVDGGQHMEQAGYDEDRTRCLKKAGFFILRFWNNEVLQEIESVSERIWMAVRKLQPHPYQQPHPHPDPPLEGEGVIIIECLQGSNENGSGSP